MNCYKILKRGRKGIEYFGKSFLRKRLERSEGPNLVHTWRTAVSERGDHKCKWSEARSMFGASDRVRSRLRIERENEGKK